MRYSFRGTALLLALGAGQASGQAVYRPQPVPVRNCPRADSVFGPIADGAHPHLRGTLMPEGVMHLDSGGEAAGRPGSADMVSFTVMALAEPHPATPAGVLHVMLSGDWARAILKANVAPPLHIELPDSVVISPTQVILGRYDGPDQFVVAPMTAVLTSATVAAIARASSVTIRIDTVPIPVAWGVLNSLHDVYRTSLCGYGSGQ